VVPAHIVASKLSCFMTATESNLCTPGMGVRLLGESSLYVNPVND